jgi:hypothetical protein
MILILDILLSGFASFDKVGLDLIHDLKIILIPANIRNKLKNITTKVGKAKSFSRFIERHKQFIERR